MFASTSTLPAYTELPVLLQSLELVSGQGGWGQLNQPAQHSGGKPAGRLHAHALPRVLVPAKASARTQAPPLLLPRRAHGALVPAGLVPDGSASASATVLTEGLKIHSGAGWGWMIPAKLKSKSKYYPVKVSQYIQTASHNPWPAWVGLPGIFKLSSKAINPVSQLNHTCTTIKWSCLDLNLAVNCVLHRIWINT